MTKKFDAARRRRYWLNIGIEGELDFQPEAVPEQALSNYLHMKVDACVNAAFVGLLPSVLPTIKAIGGWMEANPAPPLGHSADGKDPIACGIANYSWWHALGLCQFLTGATSESSFAKSAEVWVSHGLRDGESRKSGRAQAACVGLANALAGDRPEIGLAVAEALGGGRVGGDVAPLVNFGVWACKHLAEGGSRDSAYSSLGQGALEASLSSMMEERGGTSETAVWLKVIFYDTGMVATAEQAILKAYDCMPGVAKPEFLGAGGTGG